MRKLLLIVFLTFPMVAMANNIGRPVRAGNITYSFSAKTLSGKTKKAYNLQTTKHRCYITSVYDSSKRAYTEYGRLVKAIRQLNTMLKSNNFKYLMTQYLPKQQKTYKLIDANKSKRYYWNPKSVYNRLIKGGRITLLVFVDNFKFTNPRTGKTSYFPCNKKIPSDLDAAYSFVGYPYIAVSRKYLRRKATTSKISSTLMHETMHTFGYNHYGMKAYSKTWRRSAPGYLGCLAQFWYLVKNKATARKTAKFCAFLK